MRSVDSLLLDDENPPPFSSRARAHGRAAGTVLATEKFAPGVAEAVAHVFGRPVLKSEVEQAFSADVEGRFYRAKMAAGKAGVSGERLPDGLAVTFTGSVLVDYKHAGVFRRTYIRTNAGKLVAHHDLLKFDTLTVPRVGTVSVRNTLLWSKAIGVSSIMLNAEWVGRYVWATCGWSWADSQEMESKLGDFREWLAATKDRIGAYSQCFSSLGTGEVCADYPSKRQGATEIARAIVPRSWDLASFATMDPSSGAVALYKCPPQEEGDESRSVGPCPAGKVFLLSSPSWVGVLRLRDGDPGWERAKKRLKF